MNTTKKSRGCVFAKDCSCVQPVIKKGCVSNLLSRMRGVSNLNEGGVCTHNQLNGPFLWPTDKKNVLYGI